MSSNNPNPEELADLTAEVRETGQLLREVGGVVSELGPKVDEHTSVLADLREDVNTILDGMPETAHPPVDWPSLCREDAEREWDALGKWVANVLVPWYRPTREDLPDCWPLHPAVVVELSALRTSRLQAYGSTTNASAAMEWHDRWRPGTMRRIAEHIARDRTLAHLEGGQCLPGYHQADVPKPDDGNQPNRPAPAVTAPSGPWAPKSDTLNPWSPTSATPSQDFAAQRETPSTGEQSYYRPQLEKDQLAEPRHWWPALEQAKHADVERRRAQEAAIEEAERQARAGRENTSSTD